MSQTLRPASTVSDGGWGVVGAATRHAATNDSSDASYATGPSPAAELLLGLDAGSTPAGGTRTLRVRAFAETETAAASFAVVLYQGAAIVQSFDTGGTNLAPDWINVDFTVTNAITNYGTLRVGITQSGTWGDITNGTVSEALFTIPAAAPTSVAYGRASRALRARRARR